MDDLKKAARRASASAQKLISNRRKSSTQSPSQMSGLPASTLDKIAQNNARHVRISYVTCGNPSDPCVIIPPGGGATKENSLFWARDLAALGHFFVVMYDLRDTGGSQKSDWKRLFSRFGTTAVQEMCRVTGRGEGLSGLTSAKKEPGALNARLMEELWDTDAYAHDAIAVMDELKVDKAHVMGLSQGGFLSQVIALQHPDRVLTCVSAGTIFDNAGLELAMLSPGAEEFYDEVKAAKVFDEQGNPPWTQDSVNKESFVAWKTAFLRIISPGFPEEVYKEIAEKEFETGLVTTEEGAVVGLAWELWGRTGKLKRHHEQLRTNTVPIMYVHGRKDPLIHFGEVQRLFKITKNCVMEAHDFGHNFGPPQEQEKILARIVTFMKTYGRSKGKGSEEGKPLTVGSDTYATNLTVDTTLMADATVSQIYDTFCTVQTAADTHAVFDLLLEKVNLLHLRGRGLQLFVALKAALGSAGLNFKQTKLLRDVYASLLKAQKVVGRVKHGGKKSVEKVLDETIELYEEEAEQGRFNKILVCGAGPVGLRTAVELQLLGFDVEVVEKRPNFSRANILTFWDETMADMLGLGAKSYFPRLQPAGINKHLGTRQIQVCLLKTLLLLGGRAQYGMEVYGVQPPSLETPAAEGSNKCRWRGCLRPYVKHRRAAQTAAELAVEFQKSKDYVEGKGDEKEINTVDRSFVNSKETAGRMVEFDAYVIAEGGWSDSTKKLGFSKGVQNFKSIFGLVINAKYNPNDMKERNMRSQIHFALSGKWPLQRCPIQAEFLEYLKGETHFLALVVPKQNLRQDETEKYLAKMEKEKGTRAEIPQSVIDMMRLASTQKGLLEMGVLKKDLGPGRLCLAAENIDVKQLHATARAIMTELGLPEDVPFYETNPVQLFDFSRRARCLEPVRVLHATSTSSSVLGQEEFLKAIAGNKEKPTKTVMALALPVGDALQEPNWTKGLGINRGFHTGMNQAFVCLLAREKSLQAAMKESCDVQKSLLKMKWGMGNSSLAGSGSGDIGLKPFKQWDADPRNRIKYK